MIIHQINFCPVNKYNGNQFNTDLMSGFEQLESAWYRKVSGPSAICNFRTKYEGELGPNPRYKYHTIAYLTVAYRTVPCLILHPTTRPSQLFEGRLALTQG